MKHSLQSGFLDVEDFASDRKDRLKSPVAPHFGRAAGRISLDDVDLAEGRIPLLAVGELARQARPVEGRLPERQLARFFRRLARLRRDDRLLGDLLRDGGIFT